MTRSTLALLLILAPLLDSALATAAEDTGRIEGRVEDAVTSRPIVEATTLLRRDLSTEPVVTRTDAQGRYAFDAIPAGLYTVEVVADSHARALEPGVRVVPNRGTTVHFSLVRGSDVELEEVVVNARRASEAAFAAPSTVQLNREEIRRMPGSFGDVFRALDTMPGVISTGEFSSYTVRGNGPRDNLILIDGIPFDKVTHFDAEVGEESDIAGGGRYSIFAPNLIGNARFTAGGWRASEGGKFGSLLELEVADGSRSTSTLAGQLDFGGVELVYDGPAYIQDDTSVLFSARTFDFSKVLDAVGEDNSIGTPQLTDVIFKTVTELNESHGIELLAIHATEDYERTVENVLLTENFEDVSLVNSSQDSNLFGVMWRWSLGQTSTWRNTLYYRDSLKENSQGEAYPDLGGPDPTKESTPIRPDILNISQEETEFGVRSDFTTEFASGATMTAGARIARVDLDFSQRLTDDWIRYVFDDTDFRPDPSQQFIVLTPERLDSQLDADDLGYAAYADYTQPFGDFTVTPGLRFEHDDLSGQSLLSPRLGATWQATSHTRAWAGAGTYYQAPRYTELSVNPENAGLKNERSDQVMIGASHDFNDELRLMGEAYYQDLSDLIVFDDRTSGAASNIGTGKAYGVDLMLTKRLAGGWSATATYSWGHSTRNDNQGEGEYDADWDRRHAIGLVASWDITDRWSISGKWRYASGNPTDAYWVHDDVLAGTSWPYLLRYSKELIGQNLERLPDFHSLTLRADYHRSFGPVNMIAFLELANVYGRKNVSAYDWDERRGVNDASGIDDMLPFLGLRFEYSWSP